jgi:hypothetical protein
MPIPVKPCEGRFADEVQGALTSNRSREQWNNHKCEVCGLSVGAKQDRGKWVPEQHWPSVKYPASRNTTGKKRPVSSESVVPDLDGDSNAVLGPFVTTTQ